MKIIYRLFRVIVEGVAPFINAFARMAMMNNAMCYASASNLQGDYAEFGVYKGNMFALAYHYARKPRLASMRFFAFDSFEGLPCGADEYALESNTFLGGRYAIEERKFKKNIAKKGVDLSRVITIRGWFEEILTPKLKREIGLDRIAVALVDCDLYSSAVCVLNFISDLLVNGSILMFDDWYFFQGNPDNGEQKACREWLGSHPEINLIDYRKYGWHGNSFIVRRIDNSSGRLNRGMI